MGVMWTVWPLDRDMRNYMASEGIEFPDLPSRFPTGRETRSAVAALSGYVVESREPKVGKSWQAIIRTEDWDEDRWAILEVSEYSGDCEEQKIRFEKGRLAVMFPLLQTLAKSTGPLLLIPDDAGEMFIIQHETIAEWGRGTGKWIREDLIG